MEKNSGCMIMSLASMAFIDLVLFLFDVNAGLLFLAIAAVSIIFAFIANLGISAIVDYHYCPVKVDE